jgi:hypothetical protein
VLDLLLVPEDSLTHLREHVSSASKYIEPEVGLFAQLALGFYDPGQQQPAGIRRVTRLPNVPVELCAPLHCLLAEAVALAPGVSLPFLNIMLMLVKALQEVYLKVNGSWVLSGFICIWAG